MVCEACGKVVVVETVQDCIDSACSHEVRAFAVGESSVALGQVDRVAFGCALALDAAAFLQVLKIET